MLSLETFMGTGTGTGTLLTGTGAFPGTGNGKCFWKQELRTGLVCER